MIIIKLILKSFILSSAVFCFGFSISELESDLNIFGAVDIGRIQKGSDHLVNSGEIYDPTGYYLQRLYAFLNMEEQLDKRHLMSLGAGGIFWRAYSQGTQLGRIIRFGPGISHAYMKYTISENVNCQYGFFRYKYNSQAKNLGEYLERPLEIVKIWNGGLVFYGGFIGGLAAALIYIKRKRWSYDQLFFYYYYDNFLIITRSEY